MPRLRGNRTVHEFPTFNHPLLHSTRPKASKYDIDTVWDPNLFKVLVPGSIRLFDS